MCVSGSSDQELEASGTWLLLLLSKWKRVVRADDEEHEKEETEDHESKDNQEVAIDPEDVTLPEDQEREDDEEHEQEENEADEDHDPEDQESHDQEPEDSVNLTPPPEYAYEKQTALRFPCSDCGNIFIKPSSK